MREMVTYLSNYYRMSEEEATEIVSELTDLTSLNRLADYRVARAVPASTPPHDLEGL